MLGSIGSKGMTILFGQVVGIAQDDSVAVGIGADPYDWVLSVAPRLLEGFEGQDLGRLGVTVGARMRLLWNPRSRQVCAAEALNSPLN